MTSITHSAPRHSAAPVAPPAPTTFGLRTRDGITLTATRFRPLGEPRAMLVIAPAIAAAQRFYRRAAAFAQSQGFDTATLDYRSIGLNAPESLRGVAVDILRWGEQDLAAAVAHAADRADAQGLPTYLLAHSFGGQAIGLLPNHYRLRAAVALGTGAGWVGWMPRMERWRVRFLWHVLGPALTAKHGYLAWSTLGMGEDLPLDVYRQWKSWCRSPHYFFDDPALGPSLLERFARVRIPIIAANATDDRWSPPRSRDAFMRAYTGTAVERVDVDPATLGGGIGHMGYFRPNATALWRNALSWLTSAA